MAIFYSWLSAFLEIEKFAFIILCKIAPAPPGRWTLGRHNNALFGVCGYHGRAHESVGKLITETFT